MPYPCLLYKGKARLNLMPVIFLLVAGSLSAQIKWDGEAGDGKWTSAANWLGDVVPAAGDNVIMDNSFVPANYVVTLPGGTAAVTVKTLTVSPAPGNIIQLILPASNTAPVPAFVASGPGYGVIINNGGIFQNSSGNSSGNAISVVDSFRINNGGLYIHNTRAAHASLVSILSRSPGTETGVFKFDVPGGSYTFSSANRVYGTLMFSSDASGGTQFYNAIAASPLNINSDLVINPGVTINLDITNDVVIKRDFIQNGGVFNIASQANNNVTHIKGNLVQKSGSITETSTGFPVIELNGFSNQFITNSGVISNSVSVRINNPAGVTLLSNTSLPYHLDLADGIVHTNSFLVTLLNGCTIAADSTGNKSFIDGRLRKEGLSAAPHFLFPVGKDITQRWLDLQQVNGNYTVEFFKSNPTLIANNLGVGIHHISSIEYWTIETDATPVSAGSVELSFDNINSGGVTDLPSLRVAKLFNTIWQDAGNAGTTGIVGNGTVISNPVNFSTASATQYFTLSSSNALQNPLPLKDLFFTACQSGDAATIKWETGRSFLAASFELQSSENGINFFSLIHIFPATNERNYEYTDKRSVNKLRWYRLKIAGPDGYFFYSKMVAVAQEKYKDIQLIPSLVNGTSTLLIDVTPATALQISISDMSGKIVQLFHPAVVAGLNQVHLPLNSLPAGVYLLSVMNRQNRIAGTRFVKL
jgi:hypothetical protein